MRRYLDDTGKVAGALLSQVVGYTGPVTRDDLDELEERGYLRDDAIGKAGVEASFEDELRGEYGSQRVQRDASGRVVKVIETVEEPTAGTNLMLTIDARTRWS